MNMKTMNLNLNFKDEKILIEISKLQTLYLNYSKIQHYMIESRRFVQIFVIRNKNMDWYLK